MQNFNPLLKWKGVHCRLTGEVQSVTRRDSRKQQRYPVGYRHCHLKAQLWDALFVETRVASSRLRTLVLMGMQKWTWQLYSQISADQSGSQPHPETPVGHFCLVKAGPCFA
jgi:hypothetical protein